jgi:hypothetical protein
MQSFSYSQCQLQGSAYIRWQEQRVNHTMANDERGSGDFSLIMRNLQLLPDTRLSWRRCVQRQLLLSLALDTQTEVRSGHGRRGAAASASVSASVSRSVLCIALEQGADRLLLSGGLDGRVCLYRLDTPPEVTGGDRSAEGGGFVGGGCSARRERVVIRALATSQQAGAAGSGAGREEGHGGAVSAVQW